MSDQANALRGMMENRAIHAMQAGATLDVSGASDRLAHTITVTSGKGGVGKSHVALNLAVALAQQGSSVCLLDANLGLGNIDLLCGLNGYWNLSHVITGARRLEDIILTGPAGIRVVPGASGIEEVADCHETVRADILNQLLTLEKQHDFLVVDTATGIHHSVRQFVTFADVVLVLTTTELTSIADAYATVKTLSACRIPEIDLVVTQADTAQQARNIVERIKQTSKTFLHTKVESAGMIPRDPAVVTSVARRSPFLVEFPQSPASRAIVQLATRLQEITSAKTKRGEFFSHLWKETPSTG